MMVTDRKKLLEVVNEILKRGNDVQIQRKGDGVVVLEVKKTTKYKAGC